jgi:4-hydroxybenzoate polyprenyltransferase
MVKDTVTSSPFYAWIRVIRPLNLIIIAIAIIVLRYCYDGEFLKSGDWLLECLMTLPLVLLAAGGNIINDYFDIKEDRVNKPERALVGRVLKRRIALVSHWVLTTIGIVLAAFLSWKIGNIIPIWIAIAISIVLFFYSTQLKGRVLIGNFAVAASISAVIPFAYADKIDTSWNTLMNITMFIWEFGALLGLTFLIVFTRELAKDIEDIDGDKKAGHHTLPIAYSTNTSWRLITALVTILILSVGWININSEFNVFLGFFTGVTLAIANYTWKKKATQVSAWLKLLLAVGLLLCYVNNSISPV